MPHRSNLVERQEWFVYPWIWRHLPGGVGSRSACALLLVLAVCALLLFVVFPWLEPYLPFGDVTVER